jgi:hypothetical protein
MKSKASDEALGFQSGFFASRVILVSNNDGGYVWEFWTLNQV